MVKDMVKPDVKSRRDVLKEAVIKVVEKLQPETGRKFDIRRVIEPGGTRGLLRNELKGKLYPEDKKLVLEVFQELKKEKVLYHIAGVWWARI